MTEKRRITIEDVAHKAGVSAMTISRVLNDKKEISPATRQRVLAAIKELNYRPSRVARSLVTNQTFTIGLVVPDITNPFFAQIVRGAEDVAWETDYNILLCNTVEDRARERAALQLLEETQADGLIVCGARLPDDVLLPLLERHQAVVSLNRPIPHKLAGNVRIDDMEGGRQAANHLLAAGRQVIAFLAGPLDSFSSRARAQGIMAALEATGRTVNLDLQVDCLPTWEGGYTTAFELLAIHPEIDGLICFNDLMAIGAFQACTELGKRLPHELAIVGFDDIELSRMAAISLTTLRIPKYEVGAKLMRLLLDRIQGRFEPNEVVIQPELIVRASAP